MFESVRGVILAAIFLCDRLDKCIYVCLCVCALSVTIRTVFNAIENGNKDVEGFLVKDALLLKSMRPDKEKRRQKKKRKLTQTGTDRERAKNRVRL